MKVSVPVVLGAALLLTGGAVTALRGQASMTFIVVMVFVSSLFTGMGVLVARFVGARDSEKVDRTVY